MSKVISIQTMSDQQNDLFVRNYRLANPDVKAKEHLYSKSIKVVATAIDMLNSNIAKPTDPESDFFEKDVDGTIRRSFTREEYLRLLTPGLRKLVAPRCITIDGESDERGRVNLRKALVFEGFVTPRELQFALDELARYAGKTYAPGSEADTGRDVVALANVNVVNAEGRTVNLSTLPIDINVDTNLFYEDKCFGPFAEDALMDILKEALKF